MDWSNHLVGRISSTFEWQRGSISRPKKSAFLVVWLQSLAWLSAENTLSNNNMPIMGINPFTHTHRPLYTTACNTQATYCQHEVYNKYTTSAFRMVPNSRLPTEHKNYAWTERNTRTRRTINYVLRLSCSALATDYNETFVFISISTARRTFSAAVKTPARTQTPRNIVRFDWCWTKCAYAKPNPIFIRPLQNDFSRIYWQKHKSHFYIHTHTITTSSGYRSLLIQFRAFACIYIQFSVQLAMAAGANAYPVRIPCVYKTHFRTFVVKRSIQIAKDIWLAAFYVARPTSNECTR